MAEIIDLSARRSEQPSQPEAGYKDPVQQLAGFALRQRIEFRSGLESGNLKSLLADLNIDLITRAAESASAPRAD